MTLFDERIDDGSDDIPDLHVLRVGATVCPQNSRWCT